MDCKISAKAERFHVQPWHCLVSVPARLARPKGQARQEEPLPIDYKGKRCAKVGAIGIQGTDATDLLQSDPISRRTAQGVSDQFCGQN